MASINRHTRELIFKLVFYGPGLGGKTTTLQHVHAATKPESRGNMVSLATDTDRTLYFDFLPVKLMKLGDLTVKLQLYTVPGQVYYAATRKLVLSGADGVVFVADSQAARLDANVEALDDLNTNLAEQGRQLSRLPHAFQWNKRDLPDVIATAELDRRLNLFGAPAVSTVATKGIGVFEVLERVTRAVVEGYRAELPAASGKGEGPPVFLDAEDVGLETAIRQLADSQPAAPPSTERRAGASDRSSRHDHATTPAPSGTVGPFSLSELWPSADRDAVRKAEAALATRDAAGAVTACEDLVSRVLAAGSLLVGGPSQTRDPALVVVLLGLDGARYVGVRGAARAVRAKRVPSMAEAFSCYAFALEARRALDRLVRGGEERGE